MINIRVERPSSPSRLTRRSILIALAASPALVLAGNVLAQQKKPVLIGWISPGSRATLGHLLTAFKEAMAKVGWKDGVDFVVDERWADGRVSRVQELAEGLVAKKPGLVIVQLATTMVRAVTKIAPNIPVVQVSGSPPVGPGLAASLARPGGMVTGVASLAGDLAVKRLELLLDAISGAKRVGFLIDGSVGSKAMKDTASRSVERYPVDAHYEEMAGPEEIEAAVERMARAKVQALIVMPGFFPFSERARIVAAAQAHRLPVVTGHVEFAEAGALLTYGANDSALARRAAYYVDRILKGTKPGDLPIEQPTAFEVVVNLKTARALDLKIPRELLVRADRLIE